MDDTDFIAEARKAAAIIRQGGIFTAHRDLLVAEFTAELRKQLHGLRIEFAPVIGGTNRAMDILAR